jgi:hypothetical protein
MFTVAFAFIFIFIRMFISFITHLTVGGASNIDRNTWRDALRRRVASCSRRGTTNDHHRDE